ncbi:hypothetical protein P9695_11540, partial [Weizmannia sp. CD-2023]|uniref:hypothetical protein n=1 Tax=Weizmannia sp. CD-2023 TaxID=3037263 RepID=UPI002E2054AB|nr:hypothetical protein [Weizmannia sp. CD-2023]
KLSYFPVILFLLANSLALADKYYSTTINFVCQSLFLFFLKKFFLVWFRDGSHSFFNWKIRRFGGLEKT